MKKTKQKNNNSYRELVIMSMMWIWPKIFRKRALSLVSQQDLQDLGHLQIAPWWWWGGNISSSSITAVPTKAQGWKLNNNNNKKKKRICKCSVSFDLSVVLNRTGVLGVFFSLRDLELEEPFFSNYHICTEQCVCWCECLLFSYLLTVQVLSLKYNNVTKIQTRVSQPFQGQVKILHLCISVFSFMGPRAVL